MERIRFEHIFLQSRVARRTFFLFISCALVPICIFALITVNQVRDEFNQKALNHLRQTSKTAGFSIYTRLMMLENELSTYAQCFALKEKITIRKLGGLPGKTSFTNILLIDSNKIPKILFGVSFAIPTLTGQQQEHLQKSMSVLITPDRESLFIAQIFTEGNSGQGIIYGQINPDYLWGAGGEDILSSHDEELLILDHSGNTLFSTFSKRQAVDALKKNMDLLSTQRHFNWQYEDNKYLSTNWLIFLEYHFSAGLWAVISSKTSSQILAPIEHSKNIFALLLFLTICVVSLLSISMIRKNLIPIEKLKELTQRIAAGDFSQPVNIKSGDEFEDLGESFNNMADKLNRQQKILIQAERKARLFMEALPTTLYSSSFADNVCRFTFVSQGIKDFGYSVEQLMASHSFWFDRIHQEDKCVFESKVNSLPDDRGHFLEYRILAADGTWRWVMDYYRVKKNSSDEILDIMGLWIDITTRKSLEKSLQVSEKKSKNLSIRLLDSQEDERKNISKELHDDLGQLLTAVLLDIGNAMSITAEELELKPILERIHVGTVETLQKIRNISAALRPGVFDHLGLETAVGALLDEFDERSSINFRGNLQLGDIKIPESIGINLYRILQEAITNIVKHSQADQALVTLETVEGTIILSIRDNGQGFDLDNLPADSGIGLLGMGERIEALSGTIQIKSSLGKGTAIRVRCPLYNVRSLLEPSPQ